MKILVFLPRFPHPLNKGDKLRAFNQIKELSKRNDIYLFALTKKRIENDDYLNVKKYCKDIHVEKLRYLGIFLSLIKCLFNSLPLQVSLFSTCNAKKRFVHYFQTIKPNVAYFQFVRSAEYAKKISNKHNSVIQSAKLNTTRIVLDYQDCLSMNMYRRAKISPNPLKFILLQEAKRLCKYEDLMFDLFDALTIITKQDRDCIVSQHREEINVIENGVDSIFFECNNNTNRKYGIIFSGNMSYKPNIVAAKYLINEIMPLVWSKYPTLKVCLAGSSPSKEVRNLADNRVVVTGWVDDMRKYYNQSLIFVAPMQIGTGLQNKLLEAMAMGLPCVTTPLANFALSSEENKEILVGDDTKTLSFHILSLLNDSSLRKSIAQAGNSFVKANYSWQNSTAKLERLLSPIK